MPLIESDSWPSGHWKPKGSIYKRYSSLKQTSLAGTFKALDHKLVHTNLHKGRTSCRSIVSFVVHCFPSSFRYGIVYKDPRSLRTSLPLCGKRDLQHKHLQVIMIWLNTRQDLGSVVYREFICYIIVHSDRNAGGRKDYENCDKNRMFSMSYSFN